MIEESKIRERAYSLWEQDACPEGADQFYWLLARDQLRAEENASGNNPDTGEEESQKNSLETRTSASGSEKID